MNSTVHSADTALSMSLQMLATRIHKACLTEADRIQTSRQKSIRDLADRLSKRELYFIYVFRHTHRHPMDTLGKTF